MKKKRKSVLPPKPGAARQYLMDTYTPVPARDLKIGHIYLLFMENEKSITRTIHAVTTKFPCIIHPNHMRSLTNTLKSYKHLSRDKQMEDFIHICSEPFTKFTAVGVPDTNSECAADSSCPMDVDEDNLCEAAPLSLPLNIETVPGPSAAYEPFEPCELHVHVQDMSEEVTEHQPMCGPTPTVITSIRSSKGPLTPRELKLKKRLDFVSKLRSAQKRRYLNRVKDLNRKIDTVKLSKIKHLNQNIKRKSNSLAVKDAIIVQLKKELKKAKWGQTCATEEGRLQQLKRTHKRLKQSNKAKRDASRFSADTVSMEDYVKLETELSAKDDLIRTLETDQLNLEETIEELKSRQGKKTKKNGKTYSTEMRMMKKQKEIKQELSRRAAMKTHTKVEKDRKGIEKKLKSVDVGDIATQFPELDENSVTDLAGILTGDVVGRNICHVWYNADTRDKTVYSGMIEKLKKRKGNAHCYKVAYWGQEESYDDAVDYEISKFELGADLICGDLLLC